MTVPSDRGGKPPEPTTLLPGYDVTVIDSLDGLPSTTVRTISLDHDGAMWLGTSGGLCRYDGHEFRSYLSYETEGLESDRIEALLLDRSQTLWIGTERGPVSRYRRGVFEVVAPVTVLSSVSTILEGSDGTIWLCGDRLGRWRDGVLDIIDLGGRPFRTFVRDIEELANGDLVVASPRGVERFDTHMAGVVDLEMIPLGTADDTQAMGFVRDVSGEIWVTLEGLGTVRLLGDHRTLSDTVLGRVHGSLQIDANRRLLSTSSGLSILIKVGDAPAGLLRVVADLTPGGMLRTADGTLWIGAAEHGLLRLRPREFQFVNLGVDTGLRVAARVPREPADDVLVMTLDEDVILVRAKDQSDAFEPPRRVTARTGLMPLIRRGLMGPDGDFWVATSFGIGRLVDDQFVAVPGLEGDVQHLMFTDDGALWAAVGNVCREVLADERRFGRAFPALQVPPRATVPWPDGFVAVAVDRLVAFDVDRLEARELARLAGVDIRSLSRDEDGTLWITTYGDGLYRRRPGGRIDHWTARDGLPDMFLGWVGRTTTHRQDVEAGRDFLWVNSNVGAIRVDVTSLDRVAAGVDEMIATRLVRMSEGNGVSGVALSDGRLGLPTVHGLAIIDPGELEAAEAVPRLLIDEVRVDGELLERGVHDGEFHGNGSAPRGVVDLEFAYSGILFPTSRGVTFQYRLDGYDAEWFDAGTQRVARYTNLSPGNYTFRLRARSRDGAWSESPASVPYEVLPYWYQRGAVQALGGIGLFVALVLGLRSRTRAIVQRSDALEREVEHRRAIEIELRASRAEHLSVLEAAQSGVVTIRANGVIAYANPALAAMFGWPQDEIAGTHLSILRMETLRDSIAELLERSPGESIGRWVTVETTAERSDGSLLDIELSLSRYASGDDTYAICIVRDVGERKEIMDKLRRSEERYRTLFRAAPVAIIVWGTEFEIADWNERATGLFGWGRDDAIGRDFTELFGLDSVRNPMRMAATRVLSDAASQSIQHRTVRQDGELRLCRWGFAPLVNLDGSLRAVISLVTDITEEHQAARDLDNLRKRLVRAEETERSRIARELHDDLSQRLAALSLDMQMALDDVGGLRGDDLKVVLGAIQLGLQALSTDVHALSRKLHPTVLDDLGLSRALRSECTRRSRAQTAAISFVDESRGAEVSKDVALALFRIAQESMQNALKHAHATEIEVRLTRSDGQVILQVQDDGVGFDLSRVTEDGTSAGAVTGDGGLGLASMRERARLVNGDFSIRADKQFGTRVTVSVDLVSGGASEVH